jgi:hypothetical protein
LGPVIIWINGGFGAGKTTLAEDCTAGPEIVGMAGAVAVLRPSGQAGAAGAAAHLITTLHGLPTGFALSGAKADERQVLLSILDEPIWHNDYTGQPVMRSLVAYDHRPLGIGSSR